ncbi:MAG: DUF1588 domain-containing protein, partial [Verrucomicrobiales bacterium]|nr:DUF1588 domain-containing protein [Verrucomicrobiales bacterium]
LLDPRIAQGHDFETWTTIHQQLAQAEMPPADEPQPAGHQRATIATWIATELDKAQSSDRVEYLRAQFAFGNHVSHEKLFSGEIRTRPFSPPRLWRVNPNIYDQTKRRVLKHHWEELQRVRQPFALENRPGFNDYAAALYADSATLETLLRNARTIVGHQLSHDVAEPLRRMLESENPTPEQIDATVTHQFKTLVHRPPSDAESARFRTYMQTAIAEAGDPREGMAACLKAIALIPEAVYRMELGLGKPDEFGRRRLSGRELAFALSFALTDNPPDPTLWSAAGDGTLDTSDGLKTQVDRLLADDTIAKPKILRFFREFFGYHRAPDVFKDAERYRNYDWGIVPFQLVHEADLLVLHTLERDQDVLHQLLTTPNYFVGHFGPGTRPDELDQRHTALRLLHDYWVDKPWKKLDYELDPKVRADIEALHPYFRTQPARHRMSGGLIKDYMEYLPLCYKNAIRPMLAQFTLMQGERERNLTSANDQRYFLNAYNLHFESFDCPTQQPFELEPTQRAGLLTHPAWLIAHSKNTDTNPITRGKWIRERLLADHVPDVPVTVNAVVPEDPHKTLRERFQPTTQAGCWHCHKKMNPLGMTFESYDDFGRFRTRDEISGKPIDPSGRLDSTGNPQLDGPVENAVELVRRLGESGRVRQSFVRHAFRYWMGRNESLVDSATLIAADQAYLDSNGSFRALLGSLLRSGSFVYRKETKK